MNSVYTPIELSMQRLEERFHLRNQVESWFEECGLPPLPLAFRREEPMALLWRHLATARYEDCAFHAMVVGRGFKPIRPEYQGDGFCSRSSCKRSYVKRRVCSGRGRSGGLRIQRDDFGVNMRHIEGRPLREIKCRSQNLVDLHHTLHDRFFSESSRFDMTDWLKAAGSSAKERYSFQLALALSHCVMFEDFHGGESGSELDSFTDDVFMPAFTQVFQRFGIEPLIVPMPWGVGFDYYPSDLNWRSHGVVPSHLC